MADHRRLLRRHTPIRDTRNPSHATADSGADHPNWAPFFNGLLVESLRSRRDLAGQFVVRYRDPLPHVRLRLRIRAERRGAVLAALQDQIALHNASADDRCRVVGVREVSYEPEYRRYGGRRGVEIAESLFEASSDLVLAMLPALARHGGDLEVRFGHAALGIVLMLGAFFPDGDPDEVATFCVHYGEGVLSHRVSADRLAEVRATVEDIASRQASLSGSLGEVYSAAARPEFLPDPLAEASQAYVQARTRLTEAIDLEPLGARGRPLRTLEAALRTLVPSYVHMHLNRVGVLPVHEGLVCRIAAHSIRATAVEVA